MPILNRLFLFREKPQGFPLTAGRRPDGTVSFLFGGWPSGKAVMSTSGR